MFLLVVIFITIALDRWHPQVSIYVGRWKVNEKFFKGGGWLVIYIRKEEF